MTTTTPSPTTTTTATTISTTTRPPSCPAFIIVIRVVLVIVFQPALNNSQSVEFQQQARTIENACDLIYRLRYQSRFLRTVVTAFRLSRNRMSNVETDVNLVFNDTSPERLPESSDVVETLAKAINDSTSGFNLTVVPGSISVTSEPRSRAMPQFRTNDTFIADLLVSTSEAFRARASLIKTELEPFFVEDFQPDFISLTPTSFSNGSIIHMTDIIVTANSTFPSDMQIIATLTRAAESGNLSITIISISGTATTTSNTLAPTTTTTTTPSPNTTTTTTTTTTTAAATTTTTAAAAAAISTTTRSPSRPALVIEIRVLIVIIFQPALTDPQSVEFQQQARPIENACDLIYRLRYQSRFLRTVVTAFRLSRNRMDNVETDVDLVFNDTSPEPLPESSDVVETLANALNDSTSGFNLTVVPGSISVTSKPRSRAIPQFRTNDTFIADLSVSTSEAFRARASLIKTELEPFFVEDFQPDFISLTPTSFSNGSIHMTDIIVTTNSTFPSDMQMIATLTRAAESGNLSITIISINGTDTAVSAGEISKKINLLSAFGLTLLSLYVALPW
ncbi:uncharacterized protein LOC143139841 isoform X2 [Alosa pseudoharengus]|uniref:uncharacterized protein LOC143139841 isoform X2 n=1 Tax=Alosa pseudoharengus TaxID=34774 RepID=UPI003F88CC70